MRWMIVLLFAASVARADTYALRGTLVLVRATPTMPVASGRILLEDKRAVPLRPNAEGKLEGAIRVSADGEGSKIDVRSSSRYFKHDLGANAA